MQQNKIPLVAVVGPTASGKTGLAIELCRRLDGEIISGDSMQLYKRLSIATAKPTAQEQAAARHHLIDILEPWESCSVASYTQLAHAAAADIHSRGKLPIVAGGTGLYIRSFMENITFTPQPQDAAYRQALKELAERQGNQAVYSLLAQADPDAAAAIHPNNLGRVIRALEVLHTTGNTKTRQEECSRSQPSPYQSCTIGLTCQNRELLYDRIDRRVALMVEQGLLEEAKMALSTRLSPTAAQAIGYKELQPYFDGTQTLEEALERLRQQSRRYAKRQLTWFKREAGIHWLSIEAYSTTQALADAAQAVIAKALGTIEEQRREQP